MTISMREVHGISSNLHSIGYDSGTKELRARFIKWLPPVTDGGPRIVSPGALYSYADVPSSDFAGLTDLADRSEALIAQGKPVERSFTGFFNETIKGDSRVPKYAYHKVTET